MTVNGSPPLRPHLGVTRHLTLLGRPSEQRPAPRARPVSGRGGRLTLGPARRSDRRNGPLPAGNSHSHRQDHQSPFGRVACSSQHRCRGELPCGATPDNVGDPPSNHPHRAGLRPRQRTRWRPTDGGATRRTSHGLTATSKRLTATREPIGVGERRAQPVLPAPKEALHRPLPRPVADMLQGLRIGAQAKPVIQGLIADTGLLQLALGPLMPIQIHPTVETGRTGWS